MSKGNCYQNCCLKENETLMDQSSKNTGIVIGILSFILECLTTTSESFMTWHRNGPMQLQAVQTKPNFHPCSSPDLTIH